MASNASADGAAEFAPDGIGGALIMIKIADSSSTSDMSVMEV